MLWSKKSIKDIFKLNILLVANTSWYIYNFRSQLINVLLNNGYQVTVLSPSDEYTARVVELGVRHIPLQIDKAGTNPLTELFTLLRLKKTLRVEMPSVILTYNPKINIYVSLIARVLKLPVVTNVSGLGSSFISGGFIKNITSILYRVSFNWPYRIFFQNKEDRQEFVDKKFVDVSKTECLPGSGVDLNRFHPVQMPLREKIVFLLVARLLWDKGIGEYVSAARKIKEKYPNTEFQLLGFIDKSNPSAISKETLEMWVEEGVVTYLGKTDFIQNNYSTVDCVVLPSAYREGVPRTLLEAASMSLPVITTDAVGCRDAVDDNVTGYLCKVKDTSDLTEKIEKMILLSHAQRREMGMKGREKMVREFDEQVVLNRYLRVISGIEQIQRKNTKWNS